MLDSLRSNGFDDPDSLMILDDAAQKEIGLNMAQRLMLSKAIQQLRDNALAENGAIVPPLHVDIPVLGSASSYLSGTPSALQASGTPVTQLARSPSDSNDYRTSPVSDYRAASSAGSIGPVIPVPLSPPSAEVPNGVGPATAWVHAPHSHEFVPPHTAPRPPRIILAREVSDYFLISRFVIVHEGWPPVPLSPALKTRRMFTVGCSMC